MAEACILAFPPVTVGINPLFLNQDWGQGRDLGEVSKVQKDQNSRRH